MRYVRKCSIIPAATAHFHAIISEPPGGRVFPLYMNTFTNNNSVDACLNICAEYGYRAAGLEYSYQCCE